MLQALVEGGCLSGRELAAVLAGNGFVSFTATGTGSWAGIPQGCWWGSVNLGWTRLFL